MNKNKFKELSKNNAGQVFSQLLRYLRTINLTFDIFALDQNLFLAFYILSIYMFFMLLIFNFYIKKKQKYLKFLYICKAIK